MLKPLLLGIITLSSSIFLTASSAHTSTTHPLPVVDRPPTTIASNQQSDLNKIHQVLTKFYRGLNRGNAQAIAEVSVASSKNNTELKTLRQQFSQLKANNIDLSFEVKDIELTELSAESASMKISQMVKVTNPNRSGVFQQTVMFKLVKNRGEWKILDSEGLKPSSVSLAAK